eukprot:jgi/Tetstr1/425884/TSEL_016257.t1
MREFFTTTGMSDMHDKVKELIKHGFNKNNITKHDILPEDGFEMEAGTKGPIGVGLRTFPETRFSYDAVMMRNALDNCMNLWELLVKKHEAEYKEATANKK